MCVCVCLQLGGLWRREWRLRAKWELPLCLEATVDCGGKYWTLRNSWRFSVSSACAHTRTHTHTHTHTHSLCPHMLAGKWRLLLCHMAKSLSFLCTKIQDHTNMNTDMNMHKPTHTNTHTCFCYLGGHRIDINSFPGDLGSLHIISSMSCAHRKMERRSQCRCKVKHRLTLPLYTRKHESTIQPIHEPDSSVWLLTFCHAKDFHVVTRRLYDFKVVVVQ